MAPGGVELVEPIWSCPSSLLLLSLVALCGVSNEDDGMVKRASERASNKRGERGGECVLNGQQDGDGDGWVAAAAAKDVVVVV